MGVWEEGVVVVKFTDEQYTTFNQSTAGRFDPRVFVNWCKQCVCVCVFVCVCVQVVQFCKQLTKTLGSKHPAVE